MQKTIVARTGLSLLLLGAGVLHFLDPEPFVKMVPSALPDPDLLVALSGFFEIVGSVGLISPRASLRRAAAFGTIALFIAVFPANVNMAVNGLGLGDLPPNQVANWLRLPLQALLIYWAWRVAKSAAVPNLPR